ncbi:phosphatase PAP2 family protein [bacterium]|nr:phosphatase PAP2 family protein [bacterium]
MRTQEKPSRWYQYTVGTGVAVLLLIIVLTLSFPHRIADADTLFLSSYLVLLATLLVHVISSLLGRPWRALLRGVGVIMLVNYLFSAVAGMQHLIFTEWKDAALIAFETRFTGVELSHILEGITVPALTEWLMASYVIYVPLMPLAAWLAYHYRGEEELYRYLFSLLVVNIGCNLGFVLYPIASQLFYDPTQYTVPLTGGVFANMGEWMRANVHFPGGSFPSPHNAAGTVMFVFLWRAHRRWAAVFTPFLLSIPMATVYGRFHYVSDAIVGIALSVLVLNLVLLRHRAEQPERAKSAQPLSQTLEHKPQFARS